MLSTKQIFLLKAFVLALRPFCVLIDQFFFGEHGELPLIISIGTMVFLSTSIPLHIEHYREDLKSNYQKELYVNGVGLLTLFTSLMCGVFLSILYGAEIGVAITAFYVIDKFCDELARECEYKKQYYRWMGLQIYKSAWMLFAIILGAILNDYSCYLSVLGVMSSFIIFVYFGENNKLYPKIRKYSVFLIVRKTKFLLGGLISGGYQQIPRIIISNSMPEKAHLVTLIAQVFQLANVLFDARYISTHRRAMSIKTELFYSKFKKKSPQIFLGIVGAMLALTLGRIVFLNLMNIPKFDDVFIAMFVALDGFIFLYMSVYLGYLQLINDRFNFSKIYLISIFFYISLTGFVLYFVKYEGASTVYVINSVCGIFILRILSGSSFKHFHKLA
jgi:hypothetical protein